MEKVSLKFSDISLYLEVGKPITLPVLFISTRGQLGCSYLGVLLIILFSSWPQ